jgi:hypothetical protein
VVGSIPTLGFKTWELASIDPLQPMAYWSQPIVTVLKFLFLMMGVLLAFPCVLSLRPLPFNSFHCYATLSGIFVQGLYNRIQGLKRLPDVSLLRFRHEAWNYSQQAVRPSDPSSQQNFQRMLYFLSCRTAPPCLYSTFTANLLMAERLEGSRGHQAKERAGSIRKL